MGRGGGGGGGDREGETDRQRERKVLWSAQVGATRTTNNKKKETK